MISDRRTLVRVVGAVALGLGGGCEDIVEVLDPPGEGFFDVYVAVEGDRARVVEGLHAQLERVDVVLLPEGATEEQLITIRPDPSLLSIPSATFEVPLLLARGSIPVGTVQQVRLILTDTALRANGADQPLEVKVPSGEQTGVKGIPRDDVVVGIVEGMVTSGLVVIDLSRQLDDPPGIGLLLEPSSDLVALERPTIADYLATTELPLSTARFMYPLTGVVLERAKVLDTETGLIRDVAIDDAGIERSIDEVGAAETAAYRAAHGNLAPATLVDLGGFDLDSLVTVDADVAVPPATPYTPLKGATVESKDADFAAYRSARASARAPYVDAAVAQIAAAGGIVETRSDNPPLVRFTATRGAIEGTFAFLPEIASLSLPGVPVPLGYQSAQDLVEHRVFPLYGQLSSDAAARIKIVHYEPLDCVDTEHAAFAQADVQPNIGDTGSFDSHATAAVSVAASVFQTGAKAGGYRARLQGVCTIDVQDAYDAAPDVLNFSFTSATLPGPAAARDDRQSFEDRHLLVRGSGDDGTDFARCYEYNGLCVGGYNAQGTYGVDLATEETQFADDTPGLASWSNLPLDGQNMGGPAREEPDLVAPSERVTAALVAPGGNSWAAADGTSFSSPAVAGLGALFMSIFETLEKEPTALRALFMASAHHNITGPPVPLTSDAIDDFDGAGAPRADRALIMLARGALQYGELDRDLDFDVNGERTTSFEADAGQVVRVALTWDVCPYSAAAPTNGAYDFLTIDLDMVVKGPPGSPFLKANPSMVDNYETIQFIVPTSGTWTISVQAPRWTGCVELDDQGVGARRTYFGLAWDVRELETP